MTGRFFTQNRIGLFLPTISQLQIRMKKHDSDDDDSITMNCTSMSNVLVITTTMRMLHRIHSNTTNLGPAVPLHSVLVIRVSCLQHRLLSSASTSNLTNHSSAASWHNLLGSRWKLDPKQTQLTVTQKIIMEFKGTMKSVDNIETASLKFSEV